MPKYLSQVEMTFFIKSELPEGWQLTDTEEGRKLLIEGAMKCLQHLLHTASPSERHLHCLEQFVVCQHGKILPHEIARSPGCDYLRPTPENTDA
jgi:hypothetical protein